MTTALLPVAAVTRQVGFSRQTVYRMVAAGRFPAPVKLETGSVRWLENKVQEWVDRQARGPRAVRPRNGYTGAK